MVSDEPTTRNTGGFAAMRHAMVASQLRTNAVSDMRVVAAMARVPREVFVPAALSARAYTDTALPLVDGRALNPPIATGRLLTAAEVAPTDRVLLIGAATGYTAAVLADLAATVVAVEEHVELAAHARRVLADEGRVTLVEGPLAAGAPDGAPFDLLVVDAAVEELPDALVAQLTPDARIVAGLLDCGVTRLAAGSRTGGGFGLQAFADVECARLPGFARPRAFSF